jgi:pimeloyl-ACP methyl ester carboxylesterase
VVLLLHGWPYDIHSYAAVPATTLEGDANGAPHPDPSAYAKKFSGRYSHRTIEGGIGHNLPQEAPEAFVKAIVDADTY